MHDRQQTVAGRARRRRGLSGKAQRRIAWPISLILAAAGITFATLSPGDVAYWVSTAAVIPLVVVAVIQFEDPWRAARPATRALVWTAAVILAGVGAASTVVSPGSRSYIIGGLLVVPLIVLLGSIMGRDNQDDEAAADDMGAGGIFGPPM